MMQPTITIKQVQPVGGSVSMLLGDGFAAPTVDGGWEIVDRPRRKGFLNFKGYNPVQIDIPVMLDGFTTESSVEPQITTLYNMMRNLVGTAVQPAVVKITGMPVPYAGLLWVIQNIVPGAEIRRNSDGARTRVVFTITLLEYVTGDVLIPQSPAKASQQRQASAAASSGTGAPGTNGKTYAVKSGDTLWAIATKMLGNGNRWNEIATANNIRDPKALSIGQVLRIPS